MSNRRSNSVPYSRTCDMFLTFTLHPAFTKRYRNCKIQLQYTKPAIQEFLKLIKFDGICHYELTEQNNIHYHAQGTFAYPSNKKVALLWLKDYYKDNVLGLQNQRFPMLGDQFKFEQSKNFHHVDDYCKKKQEILRQHMESLTTCIWKHRDIWNDLLETMSIAQEVCEDINMEVDTVESEPE